MTAWVLSERFETGAGQIAWDRATEWRLAAAGTALIAVSYGLARYAYGLYLPTLLERLGGQRFMRIVNEVNRRLTTDDMVAMNRAVDIGEQDEALVAERFLRQNGVLEAE